MPTSDWPNPDKRLRQEASKEMAREKLDNKKTALAL